MKEHVDPVRDIETIQIELALSDLATVERRREKAQKNLKSGDKIARQELEVLDKLQPALEAGPFGENCHADRRRTRRRA